MLRFMRRLGAVGASLLLFAIWSITGFQGPWVAAAAQLPTPLSVAEIAAAMPPQSDVGWMVEYLVFTMNAEEQDAKARFHLAFNLTAAEQGSLQTVAAVRQDAVRASRGKLNAPQAAAIQLQAESSLRALLGTKYDGAVSWLQSWYAQDMAMRTSQQMQQVANQKKSATPANPVARFFQGATAASSYTTLQVYQTQFSPSGWDGALPDWDLKFATLGWCCPTPASPPYNTAQYPSPYSFGLQNLARTVSFGQVWTKEVGPFNEDDNYWNFSSYSQAINPRRCSPPPGYQYDGIPETQLALNNGYNGGRSCVLTVSGGDQIVSNVAGVDIEPDLAAAFGLCRINCNSWMYVTYTALP